jgi:hypothetical protein
MAVIDLSFVLVGTTIPLDHGYTLFSALSRIVPELHGDRRVGGHPGPGPICRDRRRPRLLPAGRVIPRAGEKKRERYRFRPHGPPSGQFGLPNPLH